MNWCKYFHNQHQRVRNHSSIYSIAVAPNCDKLQLRRDCLEDTCHKRLRKILRISKLLYERDYNQIDKLYHQHRLNIIIWLNFVIRNRNFFIHEFAISDYWN